MKNSPALKKRRSSTLALFWTSLGYKFSCCVPPYFCTRYFKMAWLEEMFLFCFNSNVIRFYVSMIAYMDHAFSSWDWHIILLNFFQFNVFLKLTWYRGGLDLWTSVNAGELYYVLIKLSWDFLEKGFTRLLGWLWLDQDFWLDLDLDFYAFHIDMNIYLLIRPFNIIIICIIL